MKWLTAMLATGILCTTVKAQEGTTKPDPKTDSIRIGGMVIVKSGENKKGVHVNVGGAWGPVKKPKKVSTNWGVVDLGFSNYSDRTDYTTAGSYLQNRPGYPALGKSDFKLRSGKSVNVNIWFFMQQISMYKNYVNLKWGLGLELNNYRYKSSVSYREGGVQPYSNLPAITDKPFIFRDSISFSKNKLAADYLTLPLMLNFESNPSQSRKSFHLSMGISLGYLYSQRNKQKSDLRGKWTNKGDYDLERFKFAYQGEIGFGSLRLYGSYSPKSMYKHSLDMRPYTIGLRFSN